MQDSMDASLEQTSSASAQAQVTYRELAWSDLDEICGLFEDMWFRIEPHIGTPIAALSARRSVLRYMCESTDGEVAVLDGHIAGVVLLKVEGRPVLFKEAVTKLNFVDAQMSANSEGCRALSDLMHWHGIEVCMDKDADVQERSQAELQLFLVSSQSRGHGVGGTLFRRMKQRLRDYGVEHFFLHTDTSCNYSFYDHQQLERIAELPASDDCVVAGDDENPFWPADDTRYIYLGAA
ncbi:GNAT family N-acetyltransferase [Bifidobacterium crudilactis]|jgi:GNAT superfamily N-acetyltransferase|uniref:GNAT family N-acetyltransferase n=1 Tax=Bifidobacterium crudilactis TaxID=327277 RepID=A0A971CY74_9BIFI|nr:GNAT family N-acetyltransferase [Bifidobacterium crudilactis]MCI1636484.1 GNAT family N-acetyltransferase [Bifidobacterium crudilactis]MCI1643220.1 GNAT family N-acetyltransferase [Bifidobacterium crudilactis]MCI1869209.1 GNAT family N-acetyltransferase [Bifidobacterium crudilactis]MCI1889266.1 GNAT family N-acetyltransferase [Bifidobacterium crudilactis]MCI2148460.1 GNAT family N-acetyltransferase [Bifidobacterium crudilactis]